MLSCQLLPMMRISRRSCLKVEGLSEDDVVNTTDLTDERGRRFADPPFDHQTYVLIDILLRVVVTGFLATCGVITNVINLVVFYRQGILSNSPTVSLAALAVSDFFCCFFNAWGAVCGVLIHFTDASRYEWDVQGFLIFTAVRPLDVFTQITCWVTAFMAFERAISVAFPFAVKAVFTPTRSLTALSFIFLLTFLLYVPNSFEEFPAWEIRSENNLTYLGWDKSGLRSPSIRRVFFYTCPVILRIASIFVVLLCNTLIFWKVNLSQKFRKASTWKPQHPNTSSVETVTEMKTKERASNVNQSPAVFPSKQADVNNSARKPRNEKKKESVSSSSCRSTTYFEVSRKQTPEASHQTAPAASAPSTTSSSCEKLNNPPSSNNTHQHQQQKEVKLLRTITVISAVFVACYSLNVVYVLLYYTVWKWGVDYHGYVDHTAWLLVSLFQTVNSSSNILIYHTLSSRFSHDLRLLCSGTRKR